jgi:hypothetical protein
VGVVLRIQLLDPGWKRLIVLLLILSIVMIVLSLFIGNIYALFLWVIGAGFFLRLFVAGRGWRLGKRDNANSD